MINFKPSLFKIIFNILIMFLGLITLYLILTNFFNNILSLVLVLILLFIYLYFYAYRDIYYITINKNKMIIKRYNNILHEINVNNAEFNFSDYKTKQKIKFQTLNIIYDDKEIMMDLELFSRNDYFLLSDTVSKLK